MEPSQLAKSFVSESLKTQPTPRYWTGTGAGLLWFLSSFVPRSLSVRFFFHHNSEPSLTAKPGSIDLQPIWIIKTSKAQVISIISGTSHHRTITKSLMICLLDVVSSWLPCGITDNLRAILFVLFMSK
jgi:hypothetical protein